MTASHITTPESAMQFELFEPDYIEALQMEAAEAAAATALRLGDMAMRFSRVERVPRYDETSRENDAEHSFMLALVATELAAQYYPQLDIGLVAQFSTVHDLVELETDDVATYTLTDEQLLCKEAAEHAALQRLLDRLPTYTRQLLQRYEAQDEPESRFVRLVDKQLPVIVDILGPGKKVMAEDYDIHTSAQLHANETRLGKRLRDKFPEEQLAFLHVVRDLLSTQFQIAFNWQDAPTGKRQTA